MVPSNKTRIVQIMITNCRSRQRCVLFTMATPLLTLGARQQPVQPAAEYSVTDLRPDLCCDNVFPTGINDAGWVLGYTYPTATSYGSDGANEVHVPSPFVWHRDSFTVPATLGGYYGQAMSINSNGDIAGFADARDTDYPNKPVTWTQSAGYSPHALSGLSGRANRMLDDGTVAGEVFRARRTWTVKRMFQHKQVRRCSRVGRHKGRPSRV